MNQAKKALLQQIYDFQQNSSEPFSISTNHVSQYDVAYLKQNGFIVETLPQLNRYNLILTAKGESFVENGFPQLYRQPLSIILLTSAALLLIIPLSALVSMM